MGPSLTVHALARVPTSGLAVLEDPRQNKGTAFTAQEREGYSLLGLLPDSVEDLEQQHQRVLLHLEHKASDLERYVYLTGLLDNNETLFYKTLMADPTRFLPIVYDPTVGEACLKFGHIYRRAHGMYVSWNMQGRVDEVLRNWPVKDVRFICVSTGGRILGLGDLGANGMGIPIGKLQLYTACAAVPPESTLPILLDIGTTNTGLRDDPLYLGLRQAPPPTEELDAFVDEFVQAVQEVFPACCIHFEDWKGTDAIRLLAKYKDKVLCYNDDIQGTASIALAGLTTALQIKGQPLKDQRILFFGAGSAAVGIANLIVSAMQVQGLSQDEARKRVAMFDIDGLLTADRGNVSEAQKPFAHQGSPSKDLAATIESLQPNALIGVSTAGGAFDQHVVEAMCLHNDRPIIFALSNPTQKAECTAEQAYTWSKGEALFAAGVQFGDVTLDGQTFHPGQANNFYIFPAIGLAVYATLAKRLTDEVFVEAAEVTAAQVTEAQRQQGMLFPPQSDILKVEVETAVHLANFIFDKGLAGVDRPADVKTWIQGLLYEPSYGRR